MHSSNDWAPLVVMTPSSVWVSPVAWHFNSPARKTAARKWFALHCPVRYEDGSEVFYWPSYGLELSPDEMLNADLKATITSRARSRAKGDLKKIVNSHLRRVRKIIHPRDAVFSTWACPLYYLVQDNCFGSIVT